MGTVTAILSVCEGRQFLIGVSKWCPIVATSWNVEEIGFICKDKFSVFVKIQ